MLKFKKLSFKKLFSIILFILLGIGFNPLTSISENIHPGAKEKEKIHPAAEGLEGIQEKVFLRMECDKEEVYVNEINALRIKLFASGFSIKDIQYPKISLKGFTLTEFDPPLQKKEMVKGLSFDTWGFRTEISAERPGEYPLGPAELQCVLQLRRGERENLPSSSRKGTEDYFGKYDSISLNLKSEKIKIRVMPFPARGKPKNFNGAVGDFHFKMEVYPKEGMVGSPMTLKMMIGGKGNFSSITAPILEKTEYFKIYHPKVIQQDGFKIFEQVLLPQTEMEEMPRAHFSFFDPDKKVYRTLHQGPLPIKVSKSEKNVVQGEREVLGKNIIYIKDSPGRLKRSGEFLYENTVFLLTQLSAFLLFLSLFFLNQRREKMRTDLRYAGQRRALKSAKKGIKETEKCLRKERSNEFYDVLFKTLQAYLGEKFQIPPGGITGKTVDQELTLKGINQNLCQTLRILFEECDTARYGSLVFGRSKMEETFRLMKETIRQLEKQKS